MSLGRRQTVQGFALAVLALLAAGCTEIDVHNNTAGPIIAFINTPDGSGDFNAFIEPGQSFPVLGDGAGPYVVSVIPGYNYDKIVKAKKDKLINDIDGAIVYGGTLPPDLLGTAADIANLQDDLLAGATFAQCSGSVTDFGTASVSVTSRNGILTC